jgi:hypothetical protein
LASLKAGKLPHLTWGRAIVGGVVALSLLRAPSRSAVDPSPTPSFQRAMTVRGSMVRKPPTPSRILDRRSTIPSRQMSRFSPRTSKGTTARPWALYIQAKAYEGKGDTDKALEAWRHLVSISRGGDEEIPRIQEAREALARLGG